MIGIIVALLTAVASLLLFLIFPTGNLSPSLELLFLTAGALFLFILALLNILPLIPLQKAEGKTTPRIIEVYSKDLLIRFYNITFMLFTILSFFAAYAVNVLPLPLQPYLFAAWILLLGVSADILRHFCKRTLHFFDPQTLIKKFTSHAIEAINNEKKAEACSWVDSLAEIGIKSITANSTNLAMQTIDEMQSITQHFLSAIKSISHPEPLDEKKNNGVDEIHYLLFYIFQRFEMINDKAVLARLEPVCHHLLTVLGKITLQAAKCDITLTEPPLHCLGFCTLQAQENHIPDVSMKGIYVLVEVAKRIIEDLDITYLGLQPTFKALLGQLEAITKKMFKDDKETNILMLMHPFQELKKLFQSPKCSTHQDTPMIIVDIDRVLGEFQALQTIMLGIPSSNDLIPNP